MNELIEIRTLINDIDKEMALLFEKRMRAVSAVAKYKKDRAMPVFDSLREAEVTYNNLQLIEDESLIEYYLPFIRATMDISKKYQRSIINAENIITVSFDGGCYDVVLEKGSISRANEYIKVKNGSKVLIVTDTGVPEKYVNAAADCFENAYIFTFEQGEKSKSFDVCERICQRLMELSFTREDSIVAVGGGVVGDVAGFVASVYMRGISFYNIPTTLLAQVDSSIGGKTAINFGNVKNVVGSFYQPKAVIIDTDVLSTLSERELRSGFAESIKMGITLDKRLFEIFLREDYLCHIDEIILRSLKAKKRIVQQDERESGLRAVLNFGHTIGHAIEAVSSGELSHGECVALGMIPVCSDEVREKLIIALKNTGLATSYRLDKKSISKAVCHDKKSKIGGITIIRCEEIGSFTSVNITLNEITELI